VNSNLSQAPSVASTKTYNVFFDPTVTGTDDNLAVLSFDILSFAPEDDTSSWIYLENVVLEEIMTTE